MRTYERKLVLAVMPGVTWNPNIPRMIKLIDTEEIQLIRDVHDPHGSQDIEKSQIRTRNLTRTYLRFFDILRPVVVGNIPYRLDFLRIDEIYHPEYIWVPRDPCHRL